MVSEVDKYDIQQVKQKRIEKDFSQSRLAFELIQQKGFIAKIESGRYGKKYNVHHINEIAKILECSPQFFLPEKPL